MILRPCNNISFPFCIAENCTTATFATPPPPPPVSPFLLPTRWTSSNSNHCHTPRQQQQQYPHHVSTSRLFPTAAGPPVVVGTATTASSHCSAPRTPAPSLVRLLSHAHSHSPLPPHQDYNCSGQPGSPVVRPCSASSPSWKRTLRECGTPSIRRGSGGECLSTGAYRKIDSPVFLSPSRENQENIR